MADSIKIGNLDINAFKVGSDDCKVYLGDTLLYSGGTTPPTPPTPSYKWLATYSDSHTWSAACDASSAITERDYIDTDNLVSFEIGNCVTDIGEYNMWRPGVFNGCYSLTSCTIGDSVTTIGDMTFYYCSGLTSVNIGSGVTTIGNLAFENCTSLTAVTVNSTTPPTLGFDAFKGSTCPIYVPSASVNAYKTATNWSSYASRIQAIPNS